MSRVATRAGFPDANRITLLENDGDEFEETLTAVNTELAGIRKVLTGILITLTTGLIIAIATAALGGFAK